MLNEEINPIQGYEGLYSITSFGRVWSHKRCINGRWWGDYFLKTQLSYDCYLYVRLSYNRISKKCPLHRLVAQAFIPNLNNLPEVNHKDGNKSNNFAGTAANNYEDGNLEWCDYDYNLKHAMENGLKHPNKKSKYYGVKCEGHGHKVWRSCILNKGKLIDFGRFYTEIEAAQAYNNYIINNNIIRLLNNIDIQLYSKAINNTNFKIYGVTFDKRRNKTSWSARVQVGKVRKLLGYFRTKLEAAKAYNNYVIKNCFNKSLNNLEVNE